ncbi:MAG TPA: glycosyltransferase family 4 protein [Myxococcales bacterium]|nr:glycosyltransferase family 4 protein [Myxococcales bacterium]
MRILFCSYHYLPSVGGVEKQSHLLASMLQARGHEVRVITTGKPNRQILDDVLIRRLPVSTKGQASMALFAAQLNAAVVGQARFAQIIHMQQALPPAATLALTARMLGKKLVVTNHGSGVSGAMNVMRKLPFGRLGLRALRSAACVALTEEMAAEMRAQGLEPRAVIANGVEVPPGPFAKERLAVFVGRLDAEKDLELLQRAAGLLRDAVIDVVGDGPVKLGEPLRLHGFSKDVPSWLSRARVFALPSKSEGMSMALLEAMAHGCACVATDVGGNRALLDGGAGSLVPPGDAKAFARELQRLLDDPAAAAKLGEAARARVLAHYSASAMVDAYERLYESL